MGKYINSDSQGNPIGKSYREKIQALIADGAQHYPANPHNQHIQFQENLVCVVDNGIFAAAGYCYDEREFQDFAEEDGRPKTWLIYPHASEVAV